MGTVGNYACRICNDAWILWVAMLAEYEWEQWVTMLEEYEWVRG